MNIIKILNESRAGARGTQEGREKLRGKGKTTADKSKVRVFNSIRDGIKKARMGQVFSTQNAGRLYVKTKSTHGGTDDGQIIAGNTAKGFTPGSAKPGSSYNQVKGYGKRTEVRYGGDTSKSSKSKKYFKSGFRKKKSILTRGKPSGEK